MSEMEKFQAKDLPKDNPYRDELLRLCLFTTESVRRMWDKYDGANEPLGFSGEAIHFELNRRGDGRYCAV